MDTNAIHVLELLASAFTVSLAWEEVGGGAIKSIPEGFVIYLN